MNKAFCKEPDNSLPPRCPKCGNDGVEVSAHTVYAHVKKGLLDAIGEPAYWCASDTCEIAYFDAYERTIGIIDAHGLYWPKDQNNPLCSCHGLTIDDIDSDLADGVPTRVRAVVHQAAQPTAICSSTSADGRSCVARVQRCYMRRRAEMGK